MLSEEKMSVDEVKTNNVAVAVKKAKRKSGRKWTKEDDNKVIQLVGKYGTHKWSFIGSLCGRNGKQCRERWHNHLDPDVKKGMWSVAEDEILRENHHKFGNRWARIAEVTDSLSPPAEAHARTHT